MLKQAKAKSNMEDKRKKYLDTLVKRNVMSKTGAEWLDRFKNASPTEQSRLINVMQEVYPTKAPRQLNEKEELPSEIKNKQRLEIIKKRYMKS
jgi:hypothetical protein